MVCTEITIIFVEAVILGTFTIHVFEFVKGHLYSNQKLLHLLNIYL